MTPKKTLHVLQVICVHIVPSLTRIMIINIITWYVCIANVLFYGMEILNTFP